ncbi:MAG: T9SS type A sorting domain-containing protein [Saprospiraceae bacterium]|nr:T9SS type A sorting domain-containing protein [Saprospiraceae bacterium]
MKKIILFINIVFCLELNAQCFPDRHSTNWFDAWVSCQEKENPNPVNKPGHWILFDLTNQYEIDKIKFWNINDPDRLNWGMKDVLIDYSVDSILWSNAGTFSLQKADGTNRYEGMDWTDVVIPKARYVLISGLTNYGGSCAGFAEIRFSAEKINIVTDNNNPDLPIANELDIKIEPNPFSLATRLEFKGNSNEPLEIQISDWFGRPIYSEQLTLNKSYQSIRIHTQQWIAGAYLLTCKQGNQITRKQLIKI